MAPQVSIVLPAYDVEAYLADAVASVIAQTMTSWELVIVDDGSSDATGAVADELAGADERISVLHQANGGVSRARNAGLARTDERSGAVVFLDADDVWEPDALATLTAALDAAPGAVAVYGFPRLFDDDHPPWPVDLGEAQGWSRHGVAGWRRVRVPPLDPTGFDVLTVWPCIATGGQVLIRRSAIREADPFVPDILSQDWLFWMRLSLRGDLVPVGAFVIRKRERAGSLMRSRRFGEAEMIVRRKLIELPEMTTTTVGVARAGHRLAPLERLSWAWGRARRGDLVGAAKHVRHFVIALAQYVRMRKVYASRVAALGPSMTDR